MTYWEAALVVLSEAEHGLHLKEIQYEIGRRGLRYLGGGSPDKTIRAELEEKRGRRFIQRLGPNYFAVWNQQQALAEVERIRQRNRYAFPAHNKTPDSPAKSHEHLSTPSKPLIDSSESRRLDASASPEGKSAQGVRRRPGSDNSQRTRPLPKASIAELGRRALAAAERGAARLPGESVRTYRRRSAVIRKFVLARARGKCQACSRPAPFRRRDGTPYLEPHHIKGLAEGGPDHPQFVAAVCPNCHREAHHGKNMQEINRRLSRRLASLHQPSAS